MNEYLAAALATDGVGSSRCLPLPPLTSRHDRDRLRRQYGYAIPNNEAIALCVRYSPLVEVGAGLGYWASLVAAAGGDVPIASDDGSWVASGALDSVRYFLVEAMDAPAAAAKYADRTLLLIWPPYNDSMATDTLLAYAGSRVIYVGESDGGCCGDDSFHALLREAWREVECIAIPQWWGLHDALYVYERKGG